MNERLEAHFGALAGNIRSCRPPDKECNCCREQPELEDEMEGILSHFSCFL